MIPDDAEIYFDPKYDDPKYKVSYIYGKNVDYKILITGGIND
jgi:hypothetical protein